MSQSFRDRFIIVVIGVCLFVPFLGSTVLWDFDEAYFASITREMMKRGEWIVPTYNGGSELGDKPIPIFWAMRLSFLMWGTANEFAARFPSALWGIGTLLVVYDIGRRLFCRDVAVRATFLLATTLFFMLESRAVTTDAPLTFWITAAMAVYLAGIYRHQTDDENSALVLRENGRWFPASLRHVILFYVCIGMAVLCKGPVFFVLPMAVVGLFALIKSCPVDDANSRWREVRFVLRCLNPIHFLRTCATLRLGIGVVVVLAVAAPWYLAVGFKTDGAWWDLFFVKHNFSRATNVMHNYRGASYYYILALLFGTFPWSIFFIPTCIDTWRRLRAGTPASDGLVFALCWCGVVMGAFSLAATKLPSYILPMYPAAALLGGNFLNNWSRGEERAGKFWTPVALTVLGLVGGGIAFVFLWVVPKFGAQFLRGEEVLSLVGFLLIGGAVVSLVVWTRCSRKTLERVFQIVCIVFLTTLFFWGGPRVAEHQKYREVFAKVRAITPHAEIVSVDCLEPSWIFYFGKPIRRMTPELFETERASLGDDVFVLIRSQIYDSLDTNQRTPFHELTRVQYLGRPYELVLLQRDKKTRGQQ
ncbi:MAG: ArnT family glycosyltransferase [Thermoguttaceae bacterium]